MTKPVGLFMSAGGLSQAGDRTRRIVLATLLALAIGVGLASVAKPSEAFGYAHRWSCGTTAGQACWDWSGQQYNYWAVISAHAGATMDQMCSRGRYSSGIDESPTTCQYNTHDSIICPANGGNVQAYTVWYGAGTTRTTDGYARTEPC